MEKIVEISEKFNFKLFLVNLGILAFYSLSLLWKLLSNMSNMNVSFFFHGLAIFAATAIAGAVTLSLMHMLLWYCCDQYKKSTGFAPQTASATTAAPTPAAASASTPTSSESNSEENK